MRYFIRYAAAEKEVTKEQYVRAERACGVQNLHGRPAEPAGNHFKCGSIEGWSYDEDMDALATELGI